MPDHLHVLFTLGDSFALSECLRLFKGRLSPVLRRHDLRWQDGYYEHRLRPDEDRLPVFLYIFLNPYRANLLPLSEKWSGYFCTSEDWAWFEPLTNTATPFPEWLQ
jgi:REP element-mobilizing transposase RayT